MVSNHPIRLLTCPVCDCPNIRTDRCPNCETDLSSIRQLRSLSPIPPSRLVQGFGFGAILGLLLGLVIGWMLRGWW
jgi:hypothetical protein